MSKEQKLRAKLIALTCEHFASCRDAQQNKAEEVLAATSIQRCWRSFVIRRNLRALDDSAVVIQSCFRGYLSRLRARGKTLEVAARSRKRHFDGAATEIQRYWRGFFSRRWTHSFRNRAVFLQTVQKSDVKIIKEMHETFEAQHESYSKHQEDRLRQRFNNTIQGLHHLVSTEVCPGVYNSPFSAVTGGPPTVAGGPLEEHLRNCRGGKGVLPAAQANQEERSYDDRSFRAEDSFSTKTHLFHEV